MTTQTAMRKRRKHKTAAEEDWLAAAPRTDEQGRAFAARYDPVAGDGLAAMDREARGTRSLGDALRATARDYAAGDAAAADGLEPP